MPSAGEIMSMRGVGMPRTAGQSAMKRALAVQQKTPMIAGTPSIEGLQKSPKIASTARRMAAAYEKLEAAKQAEADKLSPNTAKALAKLILEFEQVNQNLVSIQGQIRKDVTQKKKFYDKLYKAINRDTRQWVDDIKEFYPRKRDYNFHKIHKNIEYFIEKFGEENIFEMYRNSPYKNFVKGTGLTLQPDSDFIRRKDFTDSQPSRSKKIL